MASMTELSSTHPRAWPEVMEVMEVMIRRSEGGFGARRSVAQ
jgi:hypothetical protein